MRRSLAVAACILPMAFMVGCSDYPSSGVVDTREIREKFDIEEITGSVFGVRKDSKDAFEKYVSDDNGINRFNDAYRAYFFNGEEGEEPKLNLVYTDVSSSELEAEVASLRDWAKAWAVEQRAEYDAEVAEQQAEIDKVEAEIVTLEENLKGFEATVAEASTTFDNVRGELKSSIDAYQEVLASSRSDLEALATSIGAKGIGYSPVKNYQYIDFSNRNSQPENCPAQNGRVAADARDINGRCIYLSMPKSLAGTSADAKAREMIRDSYFALINLDAKIGDKGGWGSKKTGLYLAVDQAEEAFNEAKSAAYKKYEGVYNYRNSMYSLNQELAREKEELERMATQYTFDSYRYRVYGELPEGYEKAAEAYQTAALDHLMENYLPTVSDVTIADGDVADGVFSGLPSDLESIIVVADILAGRGNSKIVFRSIISQSLDEKSMADKDMITVETNRKNMDQRGSDASKEAMLEDLLDHYWKVTRD